ncbi:Hsp70 protein-domain-containing protein [Dactylonectria estremocensis]|uniref:non-chaperonin molecular chaperone ATPase n=1 Tax=Dactylonectria estremocensis TaxID=1079267 RepID=A0A9P9DM97_9HYPO|nr:Hsp70 protein-domain-containing protein [Dactylonectria estremocensis]
MAGTDVKSWMIGIDLGTANTRVAVFRNGVVEMIPDEDGRLSMPSCVSFNDHGRVIGSAAKSQLASNPLNTVYNVKSLLGLRMDDDKMQSTIKSVPFAIGESAGRPTVKVEYMGERKWLTVVEILSMILLRAKENAEVYLKSPVHGAFISIPPFFSTECRGAIVDAATIAGLKVAHTMPGPVAVAAFCSGLFGKGEENIVVFDLGAGRCNVALATIEEGIIEIKSMTGDNFLGGEDFLGRLVRARVHEFKTKWDKDLWVNKRAIQRLRTACEAAIRNLSSANEAHIDIDSLHERIDFHSTVTRSDFEYVCQDLFRATLDTIERALRDGKMDKGEVDRIVLVGGSSRIPKIQQLLSHYFGGKEVTKSVHPDEGEVSGLASEAAIFSGDTSSPCTWERLTLEVLPMSIGVEGVAGCMQKIIPRNATTPTKKSGYAILEKPTSFLHIYEGERARTIDCTKLASIDLRKLDLHNSWAKISSYDTREIELECTIEISRPQFRGLCTVKEKGGTKSVSAPLDKLGRLSNDDIERMMDDAARYKMVDDEERERNLARVSLDSRIGWLSELFYSLPSGPLAQRLQTSVEELRTFVDESDMTEIWKYRQPIQNLNDIELCMIRVRRGLPNRDSSLFDLQQFHYKLSSKTITPERQSALNEFRAIVDWLESSPQAEPSEYSVQLEQLVDIWERLDIANDQPGNEDDTTGSDPASDKQGKDTESNSQNVTQETSADESTVSGSTNPTPRQPRVQRAPDTETLESLFSRPFEASREPFTDSQFERISTFLRNDGNSAWSSVPRLYTVLRFINQLDAMEYFVANGITDIWFPFTNSTLPSALQPSVQCSFISVQRVVLSKGFKFEKDTERKHALFSQHEPLPFQVIGRLGRGAHGSVDKVMSIISHREYARKIFKKSRGLKRQDVKTFITELNVLKRVDHRHCVELLGSYSDPKHFALIMQPVGDHNLAEYYHKAKDSSDKISLMRSFFGCLANAMQYLHAANIRHRDIKPQNIIVKGERVLITDFGIAYNWENLTRGTTTADSGKTLVYASPEVVRVEARNESADVWSLGCVFLEMATVIKGETTSNMREVFHERSDSYAFHANRDGISAWISQLRGVAPTTDNVMLDWAASMLQHKASQRPTAGTLFDTIVTECARCDILFCGPCCMDEGSSVTDGEDDSHVWGEDDF